MKQEEKNEEQKPECKVIELYTGPVCPCCKGIDIKYYQKQANNGVIGPGYNSWVTEEYCICNTCGVHFTDVRKPKDEPKKGKVFYSEDF